MKLTKQRLKEIIREELKSLNESPMGRAQMHAKSLTKDALRLLTYLKKGDIEKVDYFIKDIKSGEIIKPDHIRRIRPGFGLAPKFEKQIIGKTVKQDIKRGTASSWELINE